MCRSTVRDYESKVFQVLEVQGTDSSLPNRAYWQVAIAAHGAG